MNPLFALWIDDVIIILSACYGFYLVNKRLKKVESRIFDNPKQRVYKMFPDGLKRWRAEDNTWIDANCSQVKSGDMILD